VIPHGARLGPPPVPLVPDELTPDRVGRSGTPTAATSEAPDLWIRRLDLGRPDWDLQAAASLLTVEELRRAGTGGPAVRRRRVLMRAALRTLLGDVLGIDPVAAPLARAAGKPELLDAPGRAFPGVSTSASGTVGLVAVARHHRIGIDVERVAETDLRAVTDERWLSPAEQAAIALLPEVQQPAAITRAWVQKEAVLKAEGVGLAADPALVDTPLADHGRIGRWNVAAVVVPLGYVAGLATQRV
jgi:4'-phosphopantetheinyl transferase